MAKKVKGATVVVEGKANLKDIINEGNKASKSLDKTKKSAQSADRQLKGAARASSGASKNFSKMSQGITGGLVPAYATLAANLFALDAVFRFLKDSADFRVLKEGQLAFAGATGIAYESLARDLQTATKGMISFREAAQAGAIGRAAGLSAGQLRELSEAAFTVSVALGRDVTDSFNRLIRGVTKAEPELLDELGIILRLEEATTKYAAALGLNKNQLSIYQKSQAVVNEVLDQAETKFGKINAIMDPQANAIAQLGVAFEEAIDKMRPMIAFFAEGIAKFGKANIDVITVAIIGFAGGIIKSVLPAQEQLAENQTTITSNVIDVDMSYEWQDSYLADDVHYNSIGAEIVATRYSDVLKTSYQCNSVNSIQGLQKEKTIVKTINLLGREVNHTPNQILFYIYDDCSVEKKFIVE